MQLLWTYKLDDGDDIWPPEYDGHFIQRNEGVFFYYRPNHRINCVEFNRFGYLNSWNFTQNNRLPLPAKWFISEEEPQILVCSHNYGIQTTTQSETSIVPEAASSRIINFENNLKYIMTEKAFSFGTYLISHEGQMGFKCKKDGEILWKTKCQGYLYTDIQLNEDGNLYFGTAGKGGKFYLIKMSTGQIIAEINTGGTKRMVVIDNSCFILKRDSNQGTLLKVSLKTGQIEQSETLPGRVSLESCLFRYETGILVTSFMSTPKGTKACYVSFVS